MTTRQPRPTFTLTLRPEPRVDGIRALRRGLKALLRIYGLRCLTIQVYPAAHAEPVRPPVANRHGNRREHRPQPARRVPATDRGAHVASFEISATSLSSVQHLIMSKGLGRIQQRILDVLRFEAGKPIPTPLLTVFVFMDDKNLAEFRAMGREIQFLSLLRRPVPHSKRNGVSRACNRLWQDGHIEGYVLKRGIQTRWWAIPAEKPQRKRRGKPRGA
jgi:hypothetical protein